MSSRGLADLHLHTRFSDGWPTPQEVVEHVSTNTTLDLVAVTDHDTIEGALRAADHAESSEARVRVIVGEEVSTRDGHVLGLFLQKVVRPGQSAAATIYEIHCQGGVAIAAHPFWRTEKISRRFGGVVHGVGWLAADLDFDGVEVENSTPGLGVANILAQRLAEASGAARIGGSDAHIVEAIDRAYTSFPGRTPKALRTAIQRGLTESHKRRYDSATLLRYMAWGFNHDRVATVRAQVAARA